MYWGENTNMNTIKITKKTRRKGVDGNRVISVRLKETTLKKLDDISKMTNRSRNELINFLLERAIDNAEIEG